MPLIPGQERSVDFACLDGRLLGTATRVKTLTSQKICHDQWGEDLASLIARTFGLSGVLNLQTMEDATGAQRLLEVMTGLTNVNLPALFLNALEGNMPGVPERVEGDVVAGRREVFWTA